MVLVQAPDAVLRWWRWALGRVLLAIWFGALEVMWCGAAWSESWLGHRALLADKLAAPLACFCPLGLAGFRSMSPTLSPWA